MADLKLVGAVAIKVRPDATGFRDATQKKIREELKGYEFDVQVTVDADTDPMEREVKRAKKEAEKGKINLAVGVDYDSIRRAQQQLERAVKNLGIETIEVELNQAGIEEARAFLASLKDESSVDVTFVPDAKGFQSVLDRIAQIRREKLEKEISFEIDDASLDAMEQEMQERLAAALGTPKVTVSYNNNRASLAAAIAQVDRELDKIRQVNIDVELDEDGLTAARRELERVLAETPVELKVNYDDQESLKRTRDKLREMLGEFTAKSLEVQFNEEAIRSELQRIDALIDDEVVEPDRQVEIPVFASRLELVARQLQFASRARRVPFHVVVDQKSVIIAEGILRSLTGINTLQAAGRGLESIITKFDSISLKAAGWGSAIGGIADALTYLVTAAFSVGDGMFEVVGLLATAPAALAVIASTAIITTMAFDNMKKALDGDAEALAELPPAARSAVKALDGTWEAIQRPVQQAFWESAGDSLTDFVKHVIPQFKTGLVDAAGGAGTFFDNVIKGFTRIALSGDLAKMFANMKVLFERTGQAATPLVDAFNILGLRGSEFLPRFGQWILDISTRFHDWIVESDKLGNINAWINDGVTSLKDMWRAGGAIIDQFKAISRAAGLIGSNGLDDFRRSMEHIARIMLSEPFQSKLGSVFFGARRGATELNKGVKDLAGSFADAAFWTGNVLTLFGRFGGEVLSGISRTIGNIRFQEGTLDALQAMSDMVNDMDPAFDRLGNLLGNIERIAGSVFRNLAPVFNSVLGILDDAVERVADNLIKIAPQLLGLTNNLLSFARGPILLAVGLLDNFLSFLNDLPAPLRDAAIAFGAFLLLRNQFGAFSGALGRMWGNITTTSAKGTSVLNTAAGKVASGATTVNTNLVKMADGSTRQLNRFGLAVNAGMTRANTALNTFKPSVIPQRLQGIVGAVTGIVGRINGALSLIGGIPGLAIGLLGVAMSALGADAARAQQNIEDLKATLSEGSGAATAQTFATIAAKISEIGEASSGWDNFWRGVVNNSKTSKETIDKLGFSLGDISEVITGSQAGYDTYIGQLRDLASIDLGRLTKFMETGSQFGAGAPQTFPGDDLAKVFAADKANLSRVSDVARGLGIKPEQLKDLGGSLNTLIGSIEEQRKAWLATQVANQLYADSLGTTADRAKEISAVTQTLGDHSIDAAGKIDAINRSLKLLRDGGLGEQEAKILRADQLEASVENARAIAGSIEASRKVIFEKNGLISEQSKAGRDLYRILRESADNVKISAQAAYDAGIKNGKTAKNALANAREVVLKGNGDLKAIADAAGITVDQLRTQWDAFFNDKDWTLTATFTGTTEQFIAAQQFATDLGIEFDQQKFTAWLMAKPDPAKVTTDEVRKYMEDFAATTFQAKLDALPAPAQAAVAKAVGAADAFARGDYMAVLKALNLASPAVQEAVGLITNRLTSPAWVARLTAALDTGSTAQVEWALLQLTRPRTALVNVTYSDVGRDNALANRPRGADGALLRRVQNTADLLSGAYPMKFFANGGIERHVANVFRPSSVLRFFAEPETGGEAYIPLAQSKRPRSVSILSEVARKFGYELTQSRNYAMGSAGPQAVATGSGGVTVTVGTINTNDPDAAVRKLQTKMSDALAVHGIN